MFAYSDFIALGLTFRSLIHFEFNFVEWETGDQVLFFCIWISSFPSSIIEDTVLSSRCVFSNFVKDQLATNVWICFWVLYYVPLVCVLVFMPIRYCFVCNSFVVCFEVMCFDDSSFVLSLKIVLALLGSSVLPCECFYLFFLFLWRMEIDVVKEIALHVHNFR
jgi:hypothetical protein